MSVKSVSARLWAPLTLTAVSTTVVAFATNLLTADKPAPWWWWLILGAGTLGVVAGGLWGYLLQSQADEPLGSAAPRVTQRDPGGPQQAAFGHGVNISAENNSAAAWHIGNVDMGGSKVRKPDRP